MPTGGALSSALPSDIETRTSQLHAQGAQDLQRQALIKYSQGAVRYHR